MYDSRSKSSQKSKSGKHWIFNRKIEFIRKKVLFLLLDQRNARQIAPDTEGNSAPGARQQRANGAQKHLCDHVPVRKGGLNKKNFIF